MQNSFVEEHADLKVVFHGELRDGIIGVKDIAMYTYDDVLENYVVVECNNNAVLGDD